MAVSLLRVSLGVYGEVFVEWSCSICLDVSGVLLFLGSMSEGVCYLRGRSSRVTLIFMRESSER